eukprot:7810825-Ditylum_brightwellii.AAC.1
MVHMNVRTMRRHDILLQARASGITHACVIAPPHHNTRDSCEIPFVHIIIHIPTMRATPSHIIQLICLGFFLPSSTNGLAFLSPSLSRAHCGSMALKMSTENGGIQAMSLRGLDEDHEAEGTKMATSITTWLDAE